MSTSCFVDYEQVEEPTVYIWSLAAYNATKMPCYPQPENSYEDWIATWNTSNSCYVSVEIEELITNDDVATTKAWAQDFQIKYPDQPILLVYIDY